MLDHHHHDTRLAAAAARRRQEIMENLTPEGRAIYDTLHQASEAARLRHQKELNALIVAAVGSVVDAAVARSVGAAVDKAVGAAVGTIVNDMQAYTDGAEADIMKQIQELRASKGFVANPGDLDPGVRILRSSSEFAADGGRLPWRARAQELLHQARIFLPQLEVHRGTFHFDNKLKGGSRKAIALFINYDCNTSCQMTLTEIYVQMRLSGKSYNSSIYNWNNETSVTYSFSMEWKPIQLEPMGVQHARCSAATQALCKQGSWKNILLLIGTNAAAQPEMG